MGGSFESYLKRARSSSEAAQAEDVEDRSNAELRTEEDSPSGESNATGETANRDGSEAAAAAEVVVVLPVSVLEAVVPTGENSTPQSSEPAVDGKTEATPILSEPKQPVDAESQSQQASGKPEVDPSAEHAARASARAETAAKAAQVVSAQAEQADRAVKASVQEQAAKPVVVPISKADAAQSSKTVEDVPTDQQASQPKKAASQASQAEGTPDRGQVGQREAQVRTDAQSRDVQQAKSVEPESFFDLKIKDSVERRREGSAGERGGESSQAGSDHPSKASNASVGTGVTSSRMNFSYLATLQETQPVSAESPSGDDGAASVAKFLLSGLNGEQAATGSDASQGVTARFVSGSGGEPVGASSGASAGGGVSQGVAAGTLFAASLTNSDAAEEMAQVLRASSGAGRQQITLQLDPPELGQLRLQVQMRNDAMTLHVEAQSQSVARMLESKLSVLRESLATHGIRVERAEIVVRSPESAEAGQHRQGGEHPQSGDRGHGPAADFGGSSRQGGRPASGEPGGPEGGGVFGDYQAESGGGLETALDGSWTMPDGASAAELSVDLVA